MKIFSFALVLVALCHFGASQVLNKASVVDVCSLPSETGRCRARRSRWFFNSVTGRCEQFTYGGCEGNGNRFNTLQDCQARCDTCLLPRKAGPCTAYFPRWYFNSVTGKCEQFIYGGCQGNANNFQTKQLCEQRCDLCRLPSKRGPCLTHFQKWFFNEDTRQCEVFIYGGCQGNANNFDSKSDCDNTCDPCDYPKKIGPCKARKPRWFFNTVTGNCEMFFWGGCQANFNNFVSKASCEALCKRCNPVNCRNIFCPNGLKKDRKGCISKRCQCVCKKCKGKTCTKGKNVCQLPPDSGCGNKNITRWFYDASHNRCSQFRYSGKGGNGNNFKSKSKCQKKCV